MDMVESFQLKWTRPESSDYPKVWHTFQAKGIENNELADYQIKDLPESKFQEAIQLLIDIFCKEAPLWAAYGMEFDR